METISKIWITFIFSSIFVSFILLIYYKLDNNIYIKKSRFINIVLLIAFLHAIFQNILPSFINPLFFMIYPSLLFALFFDIKLLRSFKTVIKFFILTLIIETILVLILKFLFHIDIQKIQWNFQSIISCLPLRFTEVVSVYLLKKRFKFL